MAAAPRWRLTWLATWARARRPAAGRRLRAVALTDNVALITAWANDARYEDIFAEQLENLLHPGDVACAISASGNSPNILAAFSFARQAGAVTAGITGFQGGKMKSLCDVCVVVPSDNMQIIEDLHVSISHAVFRVLRHEIQEANPTRAAMALTGAVLTIRRLAHRVSAERTKAKATGLTK